MLIPEFTVRVASLPVSAVEDLRFTLTATLRDEVLAANRWLLNEGREISDLLYVVIGGVQEPGLKPLLVALRRATYKGFHPGARALSEPVRAALSVDLADRVRCWVDRLAERDVAVAKLPGVMEEDYRDGRRKLYSTAAADVFQHGLLQGSPTLSRRLTQLLEVGADTEPKRNDTIKIAKYLARATAKTSPYSTFTLSGNGRWGDGDGVDEASLASATCRSASVSGRLPAGGNIYVKNESHIGETWHWWSALELNSWVTDQITRALMENPGRAAELVVRLNPSAVVAADSVSFLRPGASEALVTVPLSRGLSHCLSFLQDFPGSRWADLRDHLLAGLSSGGEDQVANYSRKLVSIGLLELRPPFHDQVSDQVAELVAWLDRTLDSDRGVVGKSLSELRKTLLTYARSEFPGQRRVQQEEIRRVVATIFSDLGLSSETLPAKNLVHETAIVASPVLDSPRMAIEGIQPELESIRRFSALFSPDLPFKLACARAFRDRFGAAAHVPFLLAYSHVHELMRENSAEPPSGKEVRAYFNGPFVTHWPLADSEVPEIAAVGSLRVQARRWLGIPGTGGPPDVALDPQSLDQLSASWPSHVLAPDSLTYYLQMLPSMNDDSPCAVLNECSIGYGRGRHRLAGLRQSADGQSVSETRRLPRYRHPDLLLAECDARWGSRLNVRPPATEHVIDYPATTTGRDPEYRIALNDLKVMSDQESGLLRLWSDRLRAWVRPLHLGLLGEFWLPPAFRFLVKAFGEASQPIYQAMSPFFDLEGWRDTKDLSGVVSTPRVTVGRVVVARRTFYVYARDVPIRAKGEEDPVYLLRLHSWHQDHHIPRRVFVRVLDRAMRDGEVGPLTKMRKPMYVDFDNWFLVASLEGSIRHPDDLLVLQEALPELPEAPEYGQERYVTEYVVELSDGVFRG